MIGQWFGYYQYDKKSLQEKLGVEKTYFKITIKSMDDSQFNGTVEDDLSTKGTPGTGVITGELNETNVSFIKQMPIQSVINAEGEMVFTKKKHLPLLYKGTLSSDGKIITGTWRFEFDNSIKNFIGANIFGAKGTFQMEKTISSF